MSTEFAKASAFRDFSALCSRVSGGVFSCSSACHYYCIYVSDPAGVLLTFVFPPKTEFQISVVNDWFHFYRPIPWFHLRVLWSHGAGGDARSVLSHWWCALILVCPGEVWLPNQWCEPHDVNIYQKKHRDCTFLTSAGQDEPTNQRAAQIFLSFLQNNLLKIVYYKSFAILQLYRKKTHIKTFLIPISIF